MRKRSAILIIVTVLILAALACSLNPQTWFSRSFEPVNDGVVTTIRKVIVEDGDIPSLYEAVNPGVVAIRALTEEGGGLGTGFVWDEQGHIVTNFHVVHAATDLEVDFPSGFKSRAQVLGSDLDSDLAVLELDQLPPELIVLTLGQNSDLLVGQTVIAIGNPKGLQGTMTLGITVKL